jgi:DinB family protein
MRHPLVSLGSFSSARAMRSAALVATLALAASARIAQAQDLPNRETAIEVRKQFVADLDSLQSKFLALANAFPADKYAWRPGPGVRSVGEVFMHVASEYYVFAPMAYGAPRSPLIPRGQDSFKNFESKSTKADVMKHLNEGFAYTKQQIAGLDPAAITGTKKLFGGDRTIIETSFAMTDDLHEHLGQLIAYARMNGVVPPWSK